MKKTVITVLIERMKLILIENPISEYSKGYMDSIEMVISELEFATEPEKEQLISFAEWYDMYGMKTEITEWNLEQYLKYS